MSRIVSRVFRILVVSMILLFAAACSRDTGQNGPGAAAAQDSPTSTTSASTMVTDPSLASGMISSDQRPAGKLSVVTTSNILADWVQAVGQDRVDVLPLLPPNTDPHSFQPGARDITRVADANLVLSLGLSLEAGWLDELVANAARNSNGVVAVGDYVDPIGFVDIFDGQRADHAEGTAGRLPAGEGETGEEQGHEELGHDGDKNEEGGHGHGALDPHFWFDPLRVKRAVMLISDQLSALDPEGESFYRSNAAAYNSGLDSLHTWIIDEVAKLPEERRLLVTSHDSFQYFAKRYGFEVTGAIMPLTTQREPAAQDLAGLIETINHEGVPAVFAEKSHSQRLAKSIAEETGAKLIGGLYVGSLGDAGGEAGTYIDLMQYNVQTIVEALRQP